MRNFFKKIFSISTIGTPFFDQHVCLISYLGSVPEESAKISSSAKTSAEEAVHDVVKDDTE